MKDLITAIWVKQPKLTARKIAKTLGIEKKETNAFLYKNQDIFAQDEAFCWSLAITYERSFRLIELNNRGIDEILKEFTKLIIRNQKCLDLKNKYLYVFSANYLKVFSRAKSFDFYGLVSTKLHRC